jgi:hypothetical protein
VKRKCSFDVRALCVCYKPSKFLFQLLTEAAKGVAQ